ncbi:MAG: hypothetical protein Q4C49_07640 [Bacillota bacterium]|nr:hypothetical protein [Bacillota bacterium]
MNEFNQMLQTTIMYAGKSYSYKSILSKEVHKLSEYIKSNKETLDFFVMKW